jgi:hypothetical protein
MKVLDTAIRNLAVNGALQVVQLDKKTLRLGFCRGSSPGRGILHTLRPMRSSLQGGGHNTQADYAVLDSWAHKAPPIGWAVAAALPPRSTATTLTDPVSVDAALGVEGQQRTRQLLPGAQAQAGF